MTFETPEERAMPTEKPSIRISSFRKKDLKASEPEVRPRPPLFRALGAAEPPQEIEINRRLYRLQYVIKHDSWAATALYICAMGRQTVCKFNRQQPLCGLPAKWLARYLAARERSFLHKLADIPNVPNSTGDVYVDNIRWKNAVAHDYIPGHALRVCEPVGAEFFADLRRLLTDVHRHNVAHVDLHKRENIIVGANGKPYLIDFQISFALSNWWPANSFPLRTVLQILQQSDEYHLAKHVARCGARRNGYSQSQVVTQPPWWIRAHRFVAVPFRTMRRNLLVKLRIRKGWGSVATEHFTEEALREEVQSLKNIA